VFSTKQDLEDRVQQLHDHLAKCGLQKYVELENAKSKTKAMYVPPSIKEPQAKDDVSKSITIHCEQFYPD